MISVEELRLKPLPFVLADHQGLIMEVNHYFQQAYGWRPEELVGESLSKILPDAFRDAHHLGFSRFQITHQSQIINHPLRLKTVCRDGREVDSEHFIIAEQSDGGWIFAATLRPLE
jgi:PAS domain S-box-containing protein